MLQSSSLIHSYKYSLLVFLFSWFYARECCAKLPATSTTAINKQVKHLPVEITRDHSVIRASDLWHTYPFSSSLSPTGKFTTPSMKNPTPSSDQRTPKYATTEASSSHENVQDGTKDHLTKILSTPSLETLSVSTIASSIFTAIQWIEQLNNTIDSFSRRSNLQTPNPSRFQKRVSVSPSTRASILADPTQKPTHDVNTMQNPHPATATVKWSQVENFTKNGAPNSNPEVYEFTIAVTESGLASDVAKNSSAETEAPTTRRKRPSSTSASQTTTDPTTMTLNITQTHNGSSGGGVSSGGQVVIPSHNASQVSVTNPNPGSILDSFTTAGTPSAAAERHVIANSSRTLSPLTTLSSESASASSNYTSDSISGTHPADTFLTTPQIIGISFGAAVVILGISIPLICWMHKKYINRVSKHYKEYWDDNVNLSYINGHLDAPREQNDDVISLDNDSFLNSLDSASFTNLWPSSDNSRRTNL